MRLRTASRLSGEVTVCELGGFGISRISHMLTYTLPELFKFNQVNLSFFHFKRHFGHIGSMPANLYKPFHNSEIGVKGVFLELSA